MPLKKWLRCRKCGLADFRKNVVLGRGVLPAEVLFIGEAPGKNEDLLGEAFIGASGRILNQAIEKSRELVGLEEAPLFYITNVCGCRPTDNLGGDNRQPTQSEALACWDRLRATYLAANPQRVIFLGKVAERYCKRAWPDGLSLVHPAYLLRTGGARGPNFRAFCRDLSEVFRDVQN